MVRRAIFAVVAITIIVGTAAATAYVARLPGSGCSTSAVSEAWSEDRLYKATTQLKACNDGETQFYSVRVDADRPKEPGGGWFMTYEVQDDESFPDGPPDVRFDSPRTLSISMKTRTLRGSIRQNVGDDLTVIETYTAKAPDYFPH